MLPDSAKAVITSGRLAHLTTLDPDGAPQVTMAWVGLDGDDILMATLPDQRKLKNMRLDPRIALSIETGGMSSYGLPEYLVVYGRASVTPGGAPELLQQLAYTYIGPGVTFPPMPDPPPGFITRITVERVGGLGPWNE